MSHSIGRLTQGGFSLVELMIAMTLGLVLVAGVAALSQNSSQIYRSLNGTSQQTENGRYALDILVEDLQHAGFFGVFAPSATTAVLPAALPSPCSEDSNTVLNNVANGFLLPVMGWNNPEVVASSLSDCIKTNGILAGSDIVAIRRVDTSVTDLASVSLNENLGNTYIQTAKSDGSPYSAGICASTTDCSGKTSAGSSSGKTPAELFSLQKKNPDTGADEIADIRRYHIDVYFIRPWSIQEGDGIPTLMRSALTNSGTSPAMTAEALVEGVENMQLQYGLDDGTAPGIANDGTPDRYVDEPADLAAWANVVTMRIGLLVRTLEPDPGYTDTKAYTLGENNVVDPKNDHFKRHVFSSVVRLVNVSSRRECKQPLPSLPNYCQS
jgi:type IV pilus assembly protein PilW